MLIVLIHVVATIPNLFTYQQVMLSLDVGRSIRNIVSKGPKYHTLLISISTDVGKKLHRYQIFW